MEQLSMFDNKANDSERLKVFLQLKGKKSRNEIHLGEFMDWLSYNLKRFKRKYKIGRYEALDSEQSESFTDFLKGGY